MRAKRLLVALLLGVGLCFIPVFGHGEVEYRLTEREMATLYMDIFFLKAQVNYMMFNPTIFLNVSFFYDPDGRYGRWFPQGINTKNRVCVFVRDNRDMFRHKAGITLLKQFKIVLESIHSFIEMYYEDMNIIVAKFSTREEIPLGYFY